MRAIVGRAANVAVSVLAAYPWPMERMIFLAAMASMLAAIVGGFWWYQCHHEELDENSLLGILMEKRFGEDDGDGDGGD